jgi:HK97 family phage portal protein
MFEYAKSKVKTALRELMYSEKFDRWIRSGESQTGVVVDQSTVFNLSTVYACINAIAQTVGSLPLVLYKRVGEGKERATEHYLFDILRNNPNPNILPSAFKEAIMGNVLTRGNGYAEIEFDVMGRPLALWPIASSRVRPVQVGTELSYDITLENKIARVPAHRIFHVPGLSFNGIEGVTPIEISREAFAMALSNQEYAARFFKNDANPGGILKHPAKLASDAYDRLKKQTENMHMGLEKKHRFMLLEGGLTWEKTGLSPADSQLLEERKFSVTDIARMFRVPPHIIADLERATFSNIEMQSIEFLTYCIMPWLVKFQEAIQKRVIPAVDKSKYFAEYLVNALLKGDTKTRFEAYGIGLDRGFLSINDVRAMENMNEVEGGDKYYKAVNMAPIAGAGENQNVTVK